MATDSASSTISSSRGKRQLARRVCRKVMNWSPCSDAALMFTARAMFWPAGICSSSLMARSATHSSMPIAMPKRSAVYRNTDG